MLLMQLLLLVIKLHSLVIFFVIGILLFHLLHSRGTVYAFDRDERRFHILESRCTAYGVGNVLDMFVF